MRRFVCGVAIASSLLACGASHKKVNGPDGAGDWYSITCRRTRANCIEEAGAVCPNGYEVADSGEQKRLVVSVNQYGGSAGEAYDGHMLVKCR